MKAKRVVVMALVALGALCAANGWAGEPLKVAVLDIQRCVTESVKGKELNKQFMTRAEAIRAELKAEEDRIKGEVEEYKKQQMLLAPEARQQREAELVQMREQFKAEVERRQEEIRKLSDEMTEKVLKDLQAILRDIVEKSGYDLVMTKTGPWLLYFDKSMEITDEVLKRYDESAK